MLYIDSGATARRPHPGSYFPYDLGRESWLDGSFCTCHSPPWHPPLRLVERGASRHRSRRRGHRISSGHWPFSIVRRRHYAHCCRCHRHRGPGKVSRGNSARPASPILGARFLVTQHQHLPGSQVGQGQETYGEDPYLTSRMGVAFVEGLQGDNPKYLKVAACAKPLCRSQRTGALAAQDRCSAGPNRFSRHLLACI